MINLKESCRKCKGIDRCIKAVAHNINNMHLPHKKDAIRCINFGCFQSTVTKYVMDGFDQALLEYVPICDYMYQAYQSFERSMSSESKYLQKVKVSPAFFAHLHAASDSFGTGPSPIPDGKVAYFNCVPIEIDDEIDGDYELVY